MKISLAVAFALAAVFSLAWAARSGRSAKARTNLERHLEERGGGSPAGTLDPPVRTGVPGRVRTVFRGLPQSLRIERLRGLLDDLFPGVGWPVFRAAWASGAVLFPVLAAALCRDWYAPPVCACLAAAFPLALPRLLRGRLARLEREGLDRFAAEAALMLQCGLSIEDAFAACAPETAPCVRRDLERLNREMSIRGDSLTAIKGFVSASESGDLALVARAAMAARETGADMRPVMASIGQAVRERAGIRRELSTQTVQGRISGYVVAALPFIFLGLSTLMSRDTVRVLFGTLPGVILLATASVLNIAGMLWIKKILDIEV